MDGTALVMDGLVRGGQALSPNLDGITDEELHGEPHPSIAWMAWRAGRVIDHNIADLIAEPQIWVKDGWHERFGMAPDPMDFGPGQLHTKAQVQAFRTPSAQTLLDYYDACLGWYVIYICGFLVKVTEISRKFAKIHSLRCP